eukprot:417598_1
MSSTPVETSTHMQQHSFNVSVVSQWNKKDILEWVNSINGLQDQWKEVATNAIKNGRYNGQHLMQLKSGKDIAKLFGIQNPMICARLWRELRKI